MTLPVARPIVTYGDEVLTRPCTPVTVFDAELRHLVADMQASMHAAEGVGLAANQIGVGKQIFVYHCRTPAGIQEGVIINPVLQVPQDSRRILVEDIEGCLSIPGQHTTVPRYLTVTVEGVSMQGEPIIPVVVSGFLARCFQHETDHLNGLLYIDRLSRTARKEVLSAYDRGNLREG